jgi:hypothetical protein
LKVLPCNIFITANRTRRLINEMLLMLLLLNKRRGRLDEIFLDRTKEFRFAQVLLQLGPIRQHGGGEDRSVRPERVGIGRIGGPGHNESNLVTGPAKNGGNAFAADSLEPVFVYLEKLKPKIVICSLNLFLFFVSENVPFKSVLSTYLIFFLLLFALFLFLLVFLTFSVGIFNC